MILFDNNGMITAHMIETRISITTSNKILHDHGVHGCKDEDV